ncbi:MAG: hydroxymethylglutaryl-CoA lyase [Flavobacteriales bacterium]
MEKITLIECPRDAMQGLHDFIPTEKKAEYLNLLLKVGFDILDFGSFVSPKAIPQLKDTAEVLGKLDFSGKTQLLAIIANERGAEDACKFNEIAYLGFPFSVSEQFQLRNTNSTREQSLDRVKSILDLCANSNKKAVVYLSMAFGNPYGEDWSSEIVLEWALRLKEMGVGIMAVSDTIGSSNSASIKNLMGTLVKNLPGVELGVHLHSHPNNWEEKMQAAYEAGCRRFDGAIKGFGGCPMAKDDLVGNMATENIVSFLESKSHVLPINKSLFSEAQQMAIEIMS